MEIGRGIRRIGIGMINSYLIEESGSVTIVDAGVPGYLGVAHAPFKPEGAGKQDMVLNGVTLDRLQDRKALLGSAQLFTRCPEARADLTAATAFSIRA